MVTPSQNPSGAYSGGPSSPSQPGGDNVKDKASALAGEAKVEGQAKVDEMRGAAADKLDTLADSAKAAASELEGDDIGHMSDYVTELAQSLGKLSSSMREKSGDDLLHEVSKLARDNPALFVTGSIAIGFGLSRFAKASTANSGPAARSTRGSDDARQDPPGRSATGTSDGASTHATGSGTTPPYGTQPPTRAATAPTGAPGNAGPQQTGVRP